MTAPIEYGKVRVKNLVVIWLIAIGFFSVSSSNEIESPDAASTASRLQPQFSMKVGQVPSVCDAVSRYNPPPIAIIRFYGQDGDFARPLKAAIDRITSLKEEVGFELRAIIPSSYLEDRENIDLITPKNNIDKIRNSLISLGVSERDMIYTARESRSNSSYEVHVFALDICPSVIEELETLLEVRAPSRGGIRPPARASAMRAWSSAGVLATPTSNGAHIGSKFYQKTRDTTAPLPEAGLRAAMSALPQVSSALRPGADVMSESAQGSQLTPSRHS